jgi:rhodanese-related sulfurtransferase
MKSFIILFATFLAVNAQERVYYDEIKDLPNHPEILLIDIRELYEIKATGMIPTSIHIPGHII